MYAKSNTLITFVKFLVVAGRISVKMENETDSAESETEKEENKVGNSENNSEISVVREKISLGEYSEVSGDTVRLKSAAYKRYTLLYCTQNDAYTGYVTCTVVCPEKKIWGESHA